MFGCDILFGIGLRDKAIFYRQLATMIDSGMLILQALESLSAMPNVTIRRIIREIYPHIRDGTPLSSVLARYPTYFDNVEIQLIRAGEVNGNLEERLKDIADFLEKLYKQRNQLLMRLIYPAILIHGGILLPPLVVLIIHGIVAYLKTVVPPLVILYSSLFCLYMLYAFFRKMPGIREWVDHILLNLPFIGDFFRLSSTYRFLMVLGDMMEGGIDTKVAVESSAQASGNYATSSILRRICKKAGEGEAISVCLRRSHLFPEMILQMIQTGEESGRLPYMLKKAASILEEQLNNAINVVTVVVPVIIYLGVALYVGYVIINTLKSIYAPIFEINKGLGK